MSTATALPPATPLRCWYESFSPAGLTDLELLSLLLFYKHADPQTGEVQLSVASIHKKIRTTASMPAKMKFHDQRQLIGAAVDSLADKGILQTITPGVSADPGKPGVAARRRIVFK